ncbi:hypothetical protein E2C01_053177 [Portunus trituberculatus]|uniref:Uncharacterized protein n=1 Tax=Portunus trituberculatus TaxID=210409 RepID=A0A5B7GJK6_PORTR|nr:hypothetical protein [Portunus trituberculatus]
MFRKASFSTHEPVQWRAREPISAEVACMSTNNQRAAKTPRHGAKDSQNHAGSSSLCPGTYGRASPRAAPALAPLWL